MCICKTRLTKWCIFTLFVLHSSVSLIWIYFASFNSMYHCAWWKTVEVSVKVLPYFQIHLTCFQTKPTLTVTISMKNLLTNISSPSYCSRFVFLSTFISVLFLFTVKFYLIFYKLTSIFLMLLSFSFWSDCDSYQTLF